MGNSQWAIFSQSGRCAIAGNSHRCESWTDRIQRNDTPPEIVYESGRWNASLWQPQIPVSKGFVLRPGYRHPFSRCDPFADFRIRGSEDRFGPPFALSRRSAVEQSLAVKDDDSRIEFLRQGSLLMPTFVELQKRLKRRQVTQLRFGADEILIVDERAAMRPGDFVDEKLRAMQNSDLTRVPPDVVGASRGHPDGSSTLHASRTALADRCGSRCTL